MQSAHALTPCGCIEENAKNRSSFGAWRHLFIATRDQLNIKISFAFASLFDSSKKSPLSLQIQTFKMNMVYLPNFFLASELLSLSTTSQTITIKGCEKIASARELCKKFVSWGKFHPAATSSIFATAAASLLCIETRSGSVNGQTLQIEAQEQKEEVRSYQQSRHISNLDKRPSGLFFLLPSSLLKTTLKPHSA